MYRVTRFTICTAHKHSVSGFSDESVLPAQLENHVHTQNLIKKLIILINNFHLAKLSRHYRSEISIPR